MTRTRRLGVFLVALSALTFSGLPALAAKGGNPPQQTKVDLRLEALSPYERAVNPGEELTLAWRLTNVSSAYASHVDMRISLPAGMRLMRVAAGYPVSCYDESWQQLVHCSADSFTSDYSTGVELTLRIETARGEVTLPATVSATEADPNTSNNTAAHALSITDSTRLPQSCETITTCAQDINLTAPARLKLTLDPAATAAGEATVFVDGPQRWSAKVNVAADQSQEFLVDLPAGAFQVGVLYGQELARKDQSIPSFSTDRVSEIKIICFPHGCTYTPRLPYQQVGGGTQSVVVRDRVGHVTLFIDWA